MINDKYESQSVCDKIIDKFLHSLSEEKGFEDTSLRLRKTLIQDNTTAEKQIREALFGKNEL